MSRRIDIELTSSLDDGTWTWRAAGARQPKGVLSGSILPAGAKVGDELKVEVEQEIDGITVLSVVHGREKQGISGLLELLPAEREFQPVVETRARRDRGDRPRRDDRDRGDRPPRGDRPDRGDRNRGGEGRGGEGRGDRGRGGEARGGDNRGGDNRGGRRDGGRERRGPSFTPPPEVPQRPKPKRLRPGKSHRQTVLAELAPEQRPIAELALQGMSAVRQRLREENEKAKAEGRAVMPEASVLKMAEELLPKLRVAEWRDRAEAAKEQADDLDLRDLRSVVVAGDDPMVARDETTRALAEELKTLLVHKQEQELVNWFGDIDAALAVGRVIRALRLSSQPPKAGVPFPSDIAQRLIDSTNASLAPMDAPDRWAAMLEAAAFSPVRSMVKPLRKPDVVSDELLATVTRLAPALPGIAALFEITVDPKAPMPKPLRPTARPTGKGGKPEGDRPKRTDRPERGPKPPKPQGPAPKPDAAQPAAEAAPAEAAPAEETVVEETSAPAEAPAPADTESSAPAELEAAEPATVAPEPATVEAEPATVEPEPATVEPEPAAAEPEPAAVEPEPATVEPEPATVEPEPATVEPEPAAVEPEPATAEPEPAAAEPEPATAEPEPATAEPEPATAEPEPATVETEPATVETEPATAEPATVETEPADASDETA